MAYSLEFVGMVTRTEQRERALKDEAYRKCEKVIREECCQKCHDGVCETCNVQRAIKRLWEVL